MFYSTMYDYFFQYKKCHVQMFSKTDGPLQKNLLLCPVSPLAKHQYSGWRKAVVKEKNRKAKQLLKAF